MKEHFILPQDQLMTFYYLYEPTSCDLQLHGLGYHHFLFFTIDISPVTHDVSYIIPTKGLVKGSVRSPFDKT